MNKEMLVALRLALDQRGVAPGLAQTGRNVTTFADRAARDVRRIGEMFSGVRGQLASLGVGVGFLANQRLSGQLDKDLIQIRQTAGGTVAQMRGLREELFAMGRETGQPLEELKSGFQTLVAAGLEWEQALAGTQAINPAAAYSRASPMVLAKALTVGAASFDFDLSKPGLAVEMLDQMVVAGEAGNAELEDLAQIFGVAGGAAARAGLSFKSTLAMIEVLAQTTPIQQMPVMLESTARLFNNQQYMARAQKVSGVRFYDEAGERRDPTQILLELAERVNREKNTKAREAMMGRILQGADLTTVTGLSTLFREGNLEKQMKIVASLEEASGRVAGNIHDSIENPIDQANRYKTAMRQIGDAFAQPINKSLADLTQFALKPKKEGGMALSNSELAGWSVGALAVGSVVGSLARHLPGKLLGATGRMLFGDTISTAAGVAQGKMLEQVAGVTPVFVTNWPAGGVGGSAAGGVADAVLGGAAGGAAAKKMGGLVGKLAGYFGPSWMPKAGTTSAVSIAGQMGVRALGGIGLAGAAGWYGGKAIGGAVDYGIDKFSSSESLGELLYEWRQSEESRARERDINKPTRATIKVVLENGQLRVSGIDAPDTDLSVQSGPFFPLMAN